MPKKTKIEIYFRKKFSWTSRMFREKMRRKFLWKIKNFRKCNFKLFKNGEKFFETPFENLEIFQGFQEHFIKFKNVLEILENFQGFQKEVKRKFFQHFDFFVNFEITFSTFSKFFVVFIFSDFSAKYIFSFFITDKWLIYEKRTLEGLGFDSRCINFICF